MEELKKFSRFRLHEEKLAMREIEGGVLTLAAAASLAVASTQENDQASNINSQVVLDEEHRDQDPTETSLTPMRNYLTLQILMAIALKPVLESAGLSKKYLETKLRWIVHSALFYTGSLNQLMVVQRAE
ncbi:unnamed protein product [Dibothriocephalus latus]|uniref:Uncharacterized protein n=1 Tax=Dibothriocephalus latus TaxID=60516 RepID=A0A3P7RWX2_DIBLA|nr:unnamed protein product [Dibothriocephalus latus]